MILENCTGMTEEERDYYVAGLVQSMRKSPEKGSIQPVSSGYGMQDIKLESKQIEALENICAYVKHNHKVYDVWNMGRHFEYGRAVTALFCGPPGTGKSMAARVLSNELKMPLYRIDLSQVVDKYIGETEKKLEEIFTYAQNSNVILFFDEADAIFGKRTDVKEAKDKYANTEVSYLLQRIEEYDGMVLLATNLKNNIDEAFMRRMKYVVDFKMPDVKTRKEIWVAGLTGNVILENIDFDFLAQKIELSGGYIKNIILNALFLAAKEGDSVSMKHILQSACNEYLKLGKLMTPGDFDKYAYYLM
jgi:SpoVK/Ycf46/Vps4 family AAA+-type ATPase